MAGYNPDDYELVEVRLEKFWKENPDGKVKTQLVESSEDGLMVICYAEIYEHKDDTEPKATGLAQEYQDDKSFANRTSWMEVCETSAIGRAISAAGFTGGNEYASADEVANAIINQDQEKDKPTEKQRTMLYGLIKKITDEDIQKELIESAKECKTRWDMSMLIDKVVKM